MKHFIFASSITIFFSLPAYTQYNETGTSYNRLSPDTGDNSIQRGFAGYLAASAGYSAASSTDSLEGSPTSLKLLGSYVTESGSSVFDVGYGFQNQTFTQDRTVDSSESTGVLEIAGRYQFDTRWQIGGVYNQFFNEGQNFNANQADSAFGGVQLLREFSFGDHFLGRAGARVMTSLNASDGFVNIISIDFQMGWGGGTSNSTLAVNDN